MDQVHDSGVGPLVFCLDPFSDKRPFLRCAFLYGPDERERQLPFLEVLTDRLAEFLFIGHIIEGIIRDLEGAAQSYPEAGQRLDPAVCCISENAAYGAGRRDEDGCLLLDDRQVFLFGDADVPRLHQLKNFAFRHRVRGGGNKLEDGQVSVVGHQPERFGVEKVSDENTCRIAPDPVCRSLAASGVRMVDHIVMEQGGGVDELDDGRHGVAALPAVPAKFGSGQKQEGPESLAAAADQVMDDLRDESHVGAEIHLHLFFDPFQIIPVIVKYVLYLHGANSGYRDFLVNITDRPSNVKQTDLVNCRINLKFWTAS